MKNIYVLLLSLLCYFNGRAQTQTPVYLSQTITNAGCRGFYRFLPADYATTTKSYPLIIWMHGAGSTGQGNAADLPKVLEFGLPKFLATGGFPASFRVNSVDYSFIIISPQFMGWPSATNIGAMITYISNNYRVDAERIYLMGLSAGGGGVWDYASASVANSDKIAAMIPFCGTTTPTQTLANRIGASKLPVWAFHNTYDGTVPVANSRNWVNYINNYVPAASPAAKLTEFPVRSNDAVVAHDCSVVPIPPSYKPEGINIYEWLLQYKRRTTITNATPVARAGNDSSVVLPGTINLNANSSTDADGIVAAYRWRKLSGPATHSFSDSTASNTSVSNLSPGTYQFELRVTDNGGAISTDIVSVTVYASFAPGSIQRVLIDVGNGTLTSTSNGMFWNNITDGRAGVRVSNAVTTLNLPSGLNVQVINRLDGTYNTASSPGLGIGNTTGIVGDYPASATTDYALIHSSATNGLWRISGMSASKVYTIKFWGSRTGTTGLRTAEIKRADETTWKSYTATSNTSFTNAAVFIISGQTSMDFNIRTKSGSDFSALCVLDISYGEEGPIGPVPNNIPIARAGTDVTIQLPQDSTLLNGCTSTDGEAAPLKFRWTKISGPANFQIVDDTVCQTRLRGLIAGSYQFQLTVTDSGSLVGKDTVNITVQPIIQSSPPIYPAICNDPYTIVILGSSTAYGSGATPIDSSWGRKLANYVRAQNSQSVVVNLGLPGYTSYHLLPTGTIPPETRPFPVDTTHNITKALQLRPKAIILNLPSNDIGLGVPVEEVKANFDLIVAKADSAKVPVWVTTTQPRNTLSPSEKLMQVELKDWILQHYGNKAIDFWTSIADANNNIATLYSANDNVHVNNAGHHLFFTRVVEEKIWDSICLRKNAAPIAAAGNDISIIGSSANVQLNGAASYDPEGGILTFKWNIIAGTGGTLNDSNILNPVFVSNTTGQYGIVLTVTDDNQQSDTDTLLISILTPNILPTANAGPDKVHNLPPNSLQLNGTGSDEDGTVTKYKWRRISGPSINFVNDSIANPVVVSLVSGIYNLELTVTDNRNGIAKDTMLLAVNAPPVANAGADIFITGTSANIQLNGATSTDPEGGSLTYEWRIISGIGATLSETATATPTFANNETGVYAIELKVTDVYSSFDLDTVNIVIETANILPVANAGSDNLIHLPPNTIALNGSASFDNDGSIVAFKWRKISGPAMIFSNDAIANPSANSLTYGVYSFELMVIDNKGGSARDTMILTVNNPPIANAGANSSITLPTNTVTLSGSASTDVDGSIISYSWSQLSGAATTITSASSVQTIVTFTTTDTYRFELTITDNFGKSTKDSVDITVLPVPTVITKNLRVNIFGGTNPYNNAQWNNWNMASSLTSARFNYDDGTASNVTAAITSSSAIADNGATYAAAATACPPQVLRYASYNTSYRTLTFSGMTNTKTYNLEFYGSRASTGNSSVFQIGNRYDTISTDNNLNDVARFTNIVPDINGRIIVTISRIGTYTYLSGFVVTENTSTLMVNSSSQTVTAVAALAQTASTDSKTLVVHPNPASDIVYVNIPAGVSGAYKLSLLNINGQIVLQKMGTKTTAGFTDKIDISDLPKGMYLLSLSIQNKNLSSSVIKF